MKKSLSDLTRDDWNRLFPIALENHNPEWKRIFQKEKERILAHIDPYLLLRIEHFGSSSIPGIQSKPYIDLMIEIPKQKLFDEQLIAQFAELDYVHFQVPAREDIETYSSFAKGYHPDGRKAQIFHIHMCPGDNVMWKQLAFRDYLIAHPERAKAYEALKLDLAARFRNNRGAYVLGKTEFVKETLRLIEEKGIH